jgi:hypothetical protein
MNLVLLAGLCASLVGAGGQDVAKKPETVDPAMAGLRKMIGGTWVLMPGDQASANPLRAEFEYKLAMGGKAVRETGVIGLGSPNPMEVEVLYGWDPQKKQVYLMNFHGHNIVYRGFVKIEGTGMGTEFEGIVGDTGQYRSHEEYPDADTMTSVLEAKQDGKWVQFKKFVFKRRR